MPNGVAVRLVTCSQRTFEAFILDGVIGEVAEMRVRLRTQASMMSLMWLSVAALPETAVSRSTLLDKFDHTRNSMHRTDTASGAGKRPSAPSPAPHPANRVIVLLCCSSYACSGVRTGLVPVRTGPSERTKGAYRGSSCWSGMAKTSVEGEAWTCWARVLPAA